MAKNDDARRTSREAQKQEASRKELMKPVRKSGKAAAAEAPPPRAYAARSLSALLPGVTRPAFKKRSPASVRLFLEWDSAVGPAYGARTAPQKLAGGTLTIACQGPVAMELQHMQAALIDRINAWSGYTLVERLRLTQSVQAAPRQSGASRKAPAPAPLSIPEMPEGPLRDALEALGGRVRARRG
ncbi:hypothetical protein ANI02nite_28720 [Acetobacter nitrogenifigens DSM 23921 = NBRC 105050]|uniref:DUF721 domain-containing protein n=2 Tax=Acetobacter nitrogenifigens TaxID=285268 RepID=A0A511XDF6_9PROT|nr:hypothetical protein ANI02nite_28720 [Acetobacter nitrogenifigens DSM 23921 = NBRC 105050]